jgi:hypothetical protein
VGSNYRSWRGYLYCRISIEQSNNPIQCLLLSSTSLLSFYISTEIEELEHVEHDSEEVNRSRILSIFLRLKITVMNVQPPNHTLSLSAEHPSRHSSAAESVLLFHVLVSSIQKVSHRKQRERPISITKSKPSPSPTIRTIPAIAPKHSKPNAKHHATISLNKRTTPPSHAASFSASPWAGPPTPSAYT